MASSIEKNTTKLTPGALNKIKKKIMGVPFRTSVTSGFTQTRALLGELYDYFAKPIELTEFYGQVIAQPHEVSKSDLVAYFTNAYFDSADETDIYLKVYVRIPLLHMCLPLPVKLLQLGAQAANSMYEAKYPDATILPLYPFFLLKLGDNMSAEPPNLGDTVRVDFLDSLNTFGRVLEISERFLGSTPNPGEGPASSSSPFSDLSKPISTVFKSDVGPEISLATSPADISRLAPGPAITDPNGNIVETVIIGGSGGAHQLIKQDFAPHIVAMLRDAQLDGVDLTVNSGFRIAFQRDNFTKEQLSALIDSPEYSDWNGSPYSPVTRPPVSQEKLRKDNCPDPVNSRASACRPPTAPPGSSGHQKGSAYDMSVVMGWGDAKTRSAPHRITAQWRWMSLNAWKYGLVRTIKNERWHWQFSPGSHQFQFVPRDHWSWDNQFNARVAYEEPT
jgi:LAS superfamily LD-carboxypeptidase LdcB